MFLQTGAGAMLAAHPGEGKRQSSGGAALTRVRRIVRPTWAAASPIATYPAGGSMFPEPGTRAAPPRQFPRLPTLGGRQVWTDRRVRRGYRAQVHAWLRGLHRLLDPEDRLILLGSGPRVLTTFEGTAPVGGAQAGPCVVALHGLGRSRRSFDFMAARLPEVEFLGLDYASAWAAPAAHARFLAEALAAMEPRTRLDLVAYSMGALVARFCLDHLGRIAPERLAAVSRLIMIAPPNRGAALADLLHRPGAKGGLPALSGLGAAAAASAPLPTVPTFVIAGDAGPRVRGWWDESNDGLIRVADTMLDGVVEHVTVPALHFLMLRDERVIGYVADFLARPLPLIPRT
jgi:triacylglycerol lipase